MRTVLPMQRTVATCKSLLRAAYVILALANVVVVMVQHQGTSAHPTHSDVDLVHRADN
jgi:hypothetical protein